MNSILCLEIREPLTKYPNISQAKDYEVFNSLVDVNAAVRHIQSQDGSQLIYMVQNDGHRMGGTGNKLL